MPRINVETRSVPTNLRANRGVWSPAEGKEGRKHICKSDDEVTEARKGWEVKADTVQKQAARELLSTMAWSPQPAVRLGSSVGVSELLCKDPLRVLREA